MEGPFANMPVHKNTEKKFKAIPGKKLEYLSSGNKKARPQEKQNFHLLFFTLATPRSSMVDP